MLKPPHHHFKPFPDPVTGAINNFKPVPLARSRAAKPAATGKRVRKGYTSGKPRKLSKSPVKGNLNRSLEGSFQWAEDAIDTDNNVSFTGIRLAADLQMEGLSKAKESFDRNFDQGPGSLEDSRMTEDQSVARGKIMVASMERPDESWDASSTTNNTFAIAIDGNNTAAMNLPLAAKRTVYMPLAKSTPQQGQLKLSDPLRTSKKRIAISRASNVSHSTLCHEHKTPQHRTVLL